jgi:LysM domain-containing protein
MVWYKEQIGPLPAGAWVATVVVGLGVSLYTRRTNTPRVLQEDTAGIPGVGVGGSGWMYTPPAEPDTVASTQPVTNEDWGRRAIDFLINQGYDPTTVDSAVRKYLSSAQLDIKERALINAALRQLGATPVPLPEPQYNLPIIPPPTNNVPKPVPPNPSPPPPPPPAPPAPRIFVVTKWPLPGSSLWTISILMYGTPKRYMDIYNANRNQIRNPDLIYPGQRLVIP